MCFVIIIITFLCMSFYHLQAVIVSDHPCYPCELQRNTQYSLLSTVDELVLVGAFVALLHAGVFPQLIRVVVEFLVNTPHAHSSRFTMNKAQFSWTSYNINAQPMTTTADPRQCRWISALKSLIYIIKHIYSLLVTSWSIRNMLVNSHLTQTHAHTQWLLASLTKWPRQHLSTTNINIH